MLIGSKDNISCISVLMPGCKFGPPDRGGVLERRNKRDQEAKLVMAAETSNKQKQFDSNRK